MFAIIDGLPYLIHGGMAIPVNLKPNGDYSTDHSQSFQTNEIGRYTHREIIAKCKKLNSIKTVKKK